MPRVQPSAVATAAEPTQRQVPWRVVAVVLVALFMATLDSYIVIVAAPALQRDLHASAAEIQWILAGYQLTYAATMITAGRLADLWGRRRILMLGTVVFVLASVLCALSPGPVLLIAARLVQGLGAAMIVPQVFTIVSLASPAAARSAVFSIVGVVLGLATVGGQLLGGLLVGADPLGTGWRSVFAVNVPIGIAVLVLTRRVVPESRATNARRLDPRGVAVLSAALLLLCYPLIHGWEQGRTWWKIAMLVVSVAAFAAFVRVEAAVVRSGGDPLLRLRLFAQRSFSLGLVLVIGVYAVITSYYLALSVSLQDGLGLTALEAGLVYAPAAAAFLVFSVLAGRLVPRFGPRVLIAGGTLVTIGYAATAIVLSAVGTFTPALVIPTLMVQSVGGGLMLAQLLNHVLTGIAPEDAGMASGVLSTAQQIGAALGIAVVGGLFFHAFRPEVDGPRDAALHGFVVASLAAGGIAALTTVLVCLLPRERMSTAGH